ncbi:hypothetical protein BBR47_27700 [Brevibacillus brevis NBRC 100599]|uniref:Uncharacterized protein n=1 Tax=Brevibacillus brevis (strain 47 / JCM 6285 / NBRC 100599) TaxID=358681 RepID=C0ZD88_BREBN|nr:hypothetical protein BBR47_27700 [Brevibacillus brevis NBRC 100599]
MLLTKALYYNKINLANNHQFLSSCKQAIMNGKDERRQYHLDDGLIL